MPHFALINDEEGYSQLWSSERQQQSTLYPEKQRIYYLGNISYILDRYIQYTVYVPAVKKKSGIAATKTTPEQQSVWLTTK